MGEAVAGVELAEAVGIDVEGEVALRRGEGEFGRDAKWRLQLEIADAKYDCREVEKFRESWAGCRIGIGARRKGQRLGEVEIAERIGKARDAGSDVEGRSRDVEGF